MYPAEIELSFDHSIYNSLLSVEEADKIVKASSELNDYLDAASGFFLSYGLEQRLGICLLHRHSECLSREWMIEYPESISGQEALITRPSGVSPMKQGAVPTVWKVLGGQFMPLEYSTDGLACELHAEGSIPDGFLDSFAKLANQSQIGHLIGLGVVSRGFYSGERPDETAIEYPGIEDRTNVVVIRPKAGLEGKTIETAWSFENTDDATRECLKSCRRQCWSVEGGHDKSHTPHHHPDPSG